MGASVREVIRAVRTAAATPGTVDWAMFAGILLGVGVVGWSSIRILFYLADGDTPVSFVPLVAVLGVALLVRCFDSTRLRARMRDRELDIIVFVLLAAATIVVLGILPTALSWDYSLMHLDVLGLILLLSTLLVMAWGLAALDQLGPALLYLLLAWPLPYLTIDNRILPALTDITVSVTRVLLPLLPGAIAADPVDATLVYVTYHGQTTSLVLAQECVGINGALGLVTIALPFALLAGGTNLARGKWLLMGLVLSWLANVMRILLIVLTAAFFGPDVALNLLHPILGMILFGLSFALLLSLAPLCGLDVAAPFRKVQHSDPVPHTTSDLILLPQPSEAPQQRWWGVLRLVLLLLAILGAGTFMENDLNKLSWLSESTLPHIGAARADDLFHAPPGWRVDDLQSMDSWQVQFGSDAVAAVLDISSPSQGSVGVQAIMARDAANFASYNVENCYVFHGYAVQGAHAVMLGNGVTGKVIDFKAEGQATAALYWLQPVQTPNGLYHERVLLIEDTMPLHVARFRPVAQPSLPQRVASAMLDLLSPWGLAQHADPAYTAMNNQLQDLATIVVAREGHAAAFSQ